MFQFLLFHCSFSIFGCLFYFVTAPFIDEYDTPFIEAHTGGFYDEVKSGLSGLLHNSLKTSNSLKYAMLTGIQRVAKENIFSDLNNLVVCDVTKCCRKAPSFCCGDIRQLF